MPRLLPPGSAPPGDDRRKRKLSLNWPTDQKTGLVGVAEPERSVLVVGGNESSQLLALSISADGWTVSGRNYRYYICNPREYKHRVASRQRRRASKHRRDCRAIHLVIAP